MQHLEVSCAVLRIYMLLGTEVLIYKTNFTSTKMYTCQMLVILLHVMARHGFHHHGVHSVCNVTPSERFVA